MTSRSMCCGTTVGKLGWVVLGVPRDSPLLHPITPPLLLQHLRERVEPEGPEAAWHEWVEPGASVVVCQHPHTRALHVLFMGVRGLPSHPVGPSRAMSPTECTV